MSKLADKPIGATPSTHWEDPTHGIQFEYGAPGMTLREHYAGLAMQGLCASSQSLVKTYGGHWVHALKTQSVEIADSLIRELEKTKE